MKVKLVTGMALIAPAALTLMFTNTPSRGQQTQGKSNREILNSKSLIERARQVKAKGGTQVSLPGPIPMYDDVDDLNEALNIYDVVIAHPTDKISVAPDARNVMTFYKFKIDEVISQPENIKTPCCGLERAPVDLPRLKPKEFYLQAGGGTVPIEGVNVSVEEEFGDLLKHQKYLLLLSLNPSSNIGMVKLGPSGVFTLDSADVLETLNKKPDVLSRQLEEQYGKSLARLKRGRN
jgi:hypothetical protein